MDDTDKRFRLTLHYDGTAFHGWQIQPRDRTVQGELERVLTRVTGSRRPVDGAGRTDTGVHATGQVAAVTVPASWDAHALRRTLNALLDDDVWVEAVDQETPGFHPRFDAVSRTYRYRLGLDPTSWSPFHRPWCWPAPAPVDPAVLERLAARLPGPGDFRAFAKAGQPERGYDCHVVDARWEPWTLGLCFVITANRYLHHMVRYLVGTMVHMASGRRSTEDWDRLLRHEPGAETSPPAPAQGLFLDHVGYEDKSPEKDSGSRGARAGAFSRMRRER